MASRLKSSASSLPERPTGPSGPDTSGKLVSYEIDLANPPPLTEAQRAELAALAALPDEAIDYSDIPQTSDDFWKHALRGRFYRPTKTSTTIRIDSDVLAWLRAHGKGWQSRINAILRREMLASLKRASAERDQPT